MQVVLFFILWLMPVWSLFGEYSIVFIHIGNEIPYHTDEAIAQARRFNPTARIILVGSGQGLKRFASKPHQLQLCCYEMLGRSAVHCDFERRCSQPKGFWRYTSERFLYLDDLI